MRIVGFFPLLLALIGLGACRTPQGSGQNDASSHSDNAVLSYSADLSQVRLPAYTQRLTLPQVTPLEDFRVELIPIKANTDASLLRLDGRFIPGDPLPGLSSYCYSEQGKPLRVSARGAKHSLRPLLMGESLILPFRGNKELAITGTDSIHVAYRYWRASSEPLQTTEADISSTLPVKEGYTAYTIHPPREQQRHPEPYYIELIPSKLLKVDCNIHSLTGYFEVDLERSGANLPYIFRSDGSTISTRMACPDHHMEEKLVRHMGLMVRRAPSEPLHIYLPEGFLLLYRYYHPEGKLELLES